VVVHDRFWLDAKSVVDRGQQLRRMNWRLDRCTGGLIALAVHIPSLDARSGDDRGVAIRPVVASVIAVSVSAGANAPFWRSPKLSDGNGRAWGRFGPSCAWSGPRGDPTSDCPSWPLLAR